MDGKKIREDFPIFSKRPDLVYFDNACTTLKPRQVIDAIVSYYSEYSACSGRSAHKMAREVDEKFEKAREKVARFVGAGKEEIVWTKNTTEAINLVANSFDFSGSKRKRVVMSNLEHHSAILPFQKLSETNKIELEFVAVQKDGTIHDEQWKNAIGKGNETALVVVHHTNNSIGTRSNLREIVRIAHDAGALVLVDGAQGVPHSEVNFKRDGYDFLAFSAHKMLGPTGIGCLVGRKDLLEKLHPFMVGGGTIQDVKLSGSTYLAPPQRFEAGIQHYAGAIGFGAAVDYLSKIGMKNVEMHEQALASRMHKALSSINGVNIYGPEIRGLTFPKAHGHGALFSFNIKGAKPHEVALLLDKSNIAVRSGVFCAQPAMESMGEKDGAVRVSLYVYNTEDEIKIFEEKLGKIAQLYK